MNFDASSTDATAAAQELGVQLLAGMAALVRRYTDRTLVTVGYASDFEAQAVPVKLDLSDDPTFSELARRVAAARADGETAADGVECDGIVAADEARLLLNGHGPSADAFSGHLRTLLEAAGEDPDRPVGQLPIVTETESEQLLVEWNRTRSAYPKRCLHELVAEQAARIPGTVAVECGEERLTYRELDERANQLAHRLVALGVGPEVLVGICMDRCAEMLVGLLGIHKAGGAYVPIDPTYPIERQEFMLSSSQAPVVITQEHLLGALPLEGLSVVCLDRDRESLAALPRSAPEVASDPEQLAYVIYTSGSTGQPKGVQIPHRALINFLVTMAERPGLTADDVLVAVTTLSFDIAGLELYLPLITGARVVIAPAQSVSDPRALAALLQSSGATVMQATPTTWRMLLDSGWTGQPAVKALCGGEALPVALADRLVQTGLELWNMYGPTETTIWSTCARIDTVGQTLTIGRPIANTTLYILDPHLQPVPVGVAGELWIGGDGLARGYRGREDLTAERFVPHPFDPTPGERIYRTGDLARYRPDGTVEFLGRIDHQVKVRGYRIELGEIETVLTRHPQVAEAVVVARTAAGGEAELAAYVIPAGSEPAAARELREFAGRSLPSYMVPLTVTTMEAFPLTPNGKVDRKALPEPNRERASDRELVAPRTGLEQQLLDIWERELGISPIGVTDNFFDLGVTSVVAATLFAAIEHELGNQLPLGAIFRAPTIEALAGLLESDPRGARWTSLIPIQPNGTKPPIFCVHGGAGTILHLQGLARRLGEDQPFYGLQSRGLYGGVAPLRTVEDMATHYLNEMRQVHPGGPWRLAGYCFGTIVAFEIAQRLVAAGEEVELVAMFNGPSPIWIRKWGWFGNQPSFRTKASLGPIPDPAQRRRNRRRRAVRRVFVLAGRVPRLLRDPQKLLNSLSWYTRKPRTRVLLALGKPVPERLREQFFFDLHSDAEHAYEPRVYPGDLVIFYGQGLYEDPALGWDGLAAGGIQTFAVPGEHTNNRHAMKEPAVGFVAERLQEYLGETAAQ
jgi:amino acid adenylation domain-containing protein